MPKVVNRAEREQELIQAAVAVFAEHGYRAATMQAVADRAGVSKGGVYEYFESKDVLLVRMAETLVHTVFETAAAALDDRNVAIASRLARFTEHLLESAEQWTPLGFSLLRVWGEARADDEDPVRQALERGYQASADRLEAALDEADTTLGRQARPCALALLAALDGALLQAMVAPEEFRRLKSSGVLQRWAASLPTVAQPQGTRG